MAKRRATLLAALVAAPIKVSVALFLACDRNTPPPPPKGAAPEEAPSAAAFPAEAEAEEMVSLACSSSGPLQEPTLESLPRIR